MNPNIELVFEDEVYCDWDLFKRVIEAITKNKVKSVSDWKVTRDEYQEVMEDRKLNYSYSLR